MKVYLIIIIAISLSIQGYGQVYKYPVIDMHMHVFSEDERWALHVPNPRTGQPMTADNPQKHFDATIAVLKKWNYKRAVIRGEYTTEEYLRKSKNLDLFHTGL